MQGHGAPVTASFLWIALREVLRLSAHTSRQIARSLKSLALRMPLPQMEVLPYRIARACQDITKLETLALPAQKTPTASATNLRLSHAQDIPRRATQARQSRHAAAMTGTIPDRSNPLPATRRLASKPCR